MSYPPSLTGHRSRASYYGDPEVIYPNDCIECGQAFPCETAAYLDRAEGALRSVVTLRDLVDHLEGAIDTALEDIGRGRHYDAEERLLSARAWFHLEDPR